ncbi:MAG: RNA-binding protein [Nitrospiraceae bacterium]|nr:MAG: RNA-binding protein [Nitrospiraceae bacterium]
MGKKLYVGSIPFQAKEDALTELFSTVGEVESVKIITDPHTGQSKGFGFVEMVSEEDAAKAIATLNGTTFMERTIIVNEARPQQPREKRGFGGGGGGGRGGFGGGGGGRGGYGRDKGAGQKRGRR